MVKKSKYMKVNIALIIIIAPILFYSQLKGAIGSEEIFITPENLKDNVTFWKKIYTEVSLKQGIIHDREFPLIIYKKITIGNRKGRSRSRYIRYQKNIVIQQIKNMIRKRPSQWTTWERSIAEMFKKHANLTQLKSSYKQIRFQQGQKERYKEGLERSGAYLAYIRLMFKLYNIPDRIIYLPHVESSFNINAYSRVGAAGMWQFMRRTGRLFKLRIDYRIDERRDPIKSTIAAAQLLVNNYKEVKSWPLAITAYNHGLTSIKRAIKVTGSKDIGVIIEKYKNRRFRFASKNFYSCFLAASEIAANAEKYFKNVNYHQPFQYKEIQLKHHLKPKTIEKYLEVSQEQIKKLNPALRSIVFSRQLPIPNGFKLRIPSTLSLDDVKQKYSLIPNSQKPSIDDINYYTVRRGDTLSSISRQYKISISDILLNNNISKKNRIYIGQVLRIPRYQNHLNKSKSPKSKSTLNQKSPTSKIKTSKTEINSSNSSSKTNNNQTANAIDKSQKPESKKKFNANLYNLDITPVKSKNYIIVTATAGESLGIYSEWLDMTVNRLRKANGWKRQIRLNQKIKIPLQSHQNTLEVFKAKRLEYHMAQEEDFYNQYQVVDIKKRKVRYGETLWSICNRDEEIPLWLLMKYNTSLDLGKLKVNTLLNIPVVEPKNNSK